jgi:hypothetical protein
VGDDPTAIVTIRPERLNTELHYNLAGTKIGQFKVKVSAP